MAGLITRMDSDDEQTGTHCVMRNCFETDNLSLLPYRSKHLWIDYIRRHLKKDGWVPTTKTSVCGKHYRVISRCIGQDRLQSVESEYHMFQTGLNTIFGQDQISYIRRRANGEHLPKGVKWRAETVASAAKMRLEFSDTTYKALIRLGYPFPSIEYMRNFAYKLEKASYQDPLESSWSEDNMAKDGAGELDREISYEDRIEAEKTTEKRNRFNYRAITSTSSHDELLPNWFTKINLDARKTLLFPEGAGGPRGESSKQPAVIRLSGNTYSNTYYKATPVIKKNPAPPREPEPEPPKKVVKLVPCAPPDFIKNKKIKVTKIDGSKLKLATVQPIAAKLAAAPKSAEGQNFKLEHTSDDEPDGVAAADHVEVTYDQPEIQLHKSGEAGAEEKT